MSFESTKTTQQMPIGEISADMTVERVSMPPQEIWAWGVSLRYQGSQVGFAQAKAGNQADAEQLCVDIAKLIASKIPIPAPAPVKVAVPAGAVPAVVVAAAAVDPSVAE